MDGISKAQFEKFLNDGYRVVPLIAKTEQIFDLASLYETFCPQPGDGGLLESGRAGRFSYIAFHPIAYIAAKDGVVHIKQDKQDDSIHGDPLELLEQFINKYKGPRCEAGPDWLGGALGYFSYDCVQYLEEMPDHARDDLHIPDLVFTVYRDLIAIDHVNGNTHLITNVLVEQGDGFEDGVHRLEEMKQRLVSLRSAEPVTPIMQQQEQEIAITPSFSKEQFEEAVEKVQEYIRSGDVFQVNLSVRQDFPIHVSPWEIYKTLRNVNPSPYMGYLHYPEFQIVSGSPELLIKVQDRKISTRPIAGTRPRGKDREEDLRLAAELIENEKERAEHIMLVDLERNDLGRVCRFGTVHVTDLMVIEEYSHVMHIVSHVEGVLDEEKTSFDAIRACFPGGTITGAPKIRTMEIIEELEPVKRGIYTGSIGWIGFNGDLELNIVIRTLIAKNGYGHVQAGAGIVIDSRPEAEYHESLKKAEALLKSVRLSEASAKMSRA